MDGQADAHDAHLSLGLAQLMLMLLALARDLHNGRPS